MAGLDDDTRELIVRLLTRAGIIMEDASAEAVLAGSGGVSLSALVQRLEVASEIIASLVSASSALLAATATASLPDKSADQD